MPPPSRREAWVGAIFKIGVMIVCWSQIAVALACGERVKFATQTLRTVREASLCNVAISMSDESLQKLSWSEFVSDIKDTELIQYLKERNLYINEMVEETEEY